MIALFLFQIKLTEDYKIDVYPQSEPGDNANYDNEIIPSANPFFPSE